MLDDVDDFVAACATNAQAFHANSPSGHFEAGDIYCPACGGPRRVNVGVLRASKPGLGYLEVSDPSTEAIAMQIGPALFWMTCRQGCGTGFLALLFRGPERKFELAVFPSRRGGLALPHTPKGVAFYLDQAQRAESVDANSAAVAMYRAALEHLLYEQGFTARMLGNKINALEEAMGDGSAPAWARELDPEYLKVLKSLGDAAIHPGDGDVSAQDTLDKRLLRNVKITFVELLRLVYEQPLERAERLGQLKDSLADMSKPARAPAAENERPA